MNKACRHWHTANSAAVIAVGMGIATPMGSTAFLPTTHQTMLVNRKFKLEVPTKIAGKSDLLSDFLFHIE